MSAEPVCSGRQRSQPTPCHHSIKRPSSEPACAKHWDKLSSSTGLSTLQSASKHPILLAQHQGRLTAPPHQSSQAQDHCSSLLFLRHSLIAPQKPADPSQSRLTRRHQTSYMQSHLRLEKKMFSSPIQY